VGATALHVGVLPPIDLGLLYRDSLHQVAEVPIHRLCLELVWLGDRSEHHGCHNHVFPGVEEVLRTIIALCDLVTGLPRLRLFSFEASLLNVAINLVEPLDECVELLLLLSKGGFTGEDACLMLALVFLLLDGGSRVPPLLLPHGGLAAKQALSCTSSESKLGFVEALLESSSRFMVGPCSPTV
jgi:hypothetical protein